MYEITFSKKYEKTVKKFFKKHQNLKGKYTKTILLLQKNPFYPSLRLHKLQGSLSEYHSVSIDMDYRILIDFIIIDEQIILIDIGSHDEVY
ncbi:type II toxin-antitoxin system mRNA interferase toxin, RelE/StbE family [Sulfurimonas sp. NWX367]|uniref:type II toxin-antitoxin system RelE/ParE family toxin n=1 Tax=Sulfurimonas sp. NWX367 TaxID=2925413 RepID=UPI00320472FD